MESILEWKILVESILEWKILYSGKIIRMKNIREEGTLKWKIYQKGKYIRKEIILKMMENISIYFSLNTFLCFLAEPSVTAKGGKS